MHQHAYGEQAPTHRGTRRRFPSAQIQTGGRHASRLPQRTSVLSLTPCIFAAEIISRLKQTPSQNSTVAVLSCSLPTKNALIAEVLHHPQRENLIHCVAAVQRSRRQRQAASAPRQSNNLRRLSCRSTRNQLSTKTHWTAIAASCRWTAIAGWCCDRRCPPKRAIYMQLNSTGAIECKAVSAWIPSLARNQHLKDTCAGCPLE